MLAYWKSFRRYWKPATLMFLLTLMVGMAVTLSLPKIYRSTATVLVADENPASAAIDSASTGYADRRIEILRKRVLATSNLNQMAKELALFPGSEFSTNGRLKTHLVNQLRNNIEIKLVKVKAADSVVRYAIESAIAFDLSYNHPDPDVAQKVTAYLLDLILEENTGSGNLPGDATESLLTDRSTDIKHRLEQAEEKLRQFKEKNVYALPDLKESNLRTLDKTEDEISDVRLQIRAARDQLIYLESELSRLKPYALSFDSEGNRVLGAEDRLKTLRAELASKRARYSEEHPDIVKLNDEILSLRAETNGSPAISEIAAQIRQLRAEKAELSTRYSPDHPTLASINRQLNSLQQELNREQRRARTTSRPRNADNPAYISTSAQLKSAKLEIRELEDRLLKLQAKRRIYEKRVEDSPLVERQFNELDRNYQQLATEFKTLREKRFAAELSGSLKESNYKQGLVVLEPASYPESAHKPNRKVLSMLSLFLAFWAGLGTAFILRQLDNRIWLPEDILKSMDQPPLAVIPLYPIGAGNYPGSTKSTRS